MYWIVKCEFPDEDNICYVTEDSIMGHLVKKFLTHEEAEKYCRENLPNLIYNIIETKE